MAVPRAVSGLAGQMDGAAKHQTDVQTARYICDSRGCYHSTRVTAVHIYLLTRGRILPRGGHDAFDQLRWALVAGRKEVAVRRLRTSGCLAVNFCPCLHLGCWQALREVL